MSRAAHDPLLAVPHVILEVEARRDKSGLIYLRRTLPPTSRFDAWCRRMLRTPRVFHMELDEPGTTYWELIDGKRNLHAFVPTFLSQYSMSRDEARQAIVTYTSDLMIRHLIQLELPQR